MCMLCIVPPNVIPSRDKLEASALNNPHGFGFAIVIPKEKRIHSERTMNADTSINRFIEMRGQYPEGYAMWHARLATHGSMTVDNCHPFAVGGDIQTYLAHNGILPIIEPKGDKRSDTRIFAEDLLPAIGGVSALDNPQVMNLIEDFTSGSKVAILTVDPRAQYQCYVIHEEKGVCDASGVWWSNDSCYLTSYGALGTWKAVKPYDFGLSNDEESFVECIICQKVTGIEELEDTYCPQCKSCFDCNMHKTGCMCFEPRRKASILGEGGWATW